MVDRDLNDVYKKLAELPLRRFAEVLRNKAMDLVSQLGQPAYFDQYPSKRVPWIFSRTYGPIPLTSTRKLPSTSEVLVSSTATALGGAFTLVDATQAWTVDEFAGFTVTITAGTGIGQTRIIASNTATVLTTTSAWATIPDATSGYQVLGAGGFSQLAPVANPSEFLLPREGTIKTGREAAFVWCSSNAFAYVNWTYTKSLETAEWQFPVAAVGAGDILDPVLSMNGGAVVIPNIANANHTSPRVCFELALYDKKRGRFLTDGSLPAEAFVGGVFSNKMTPKQTRFNVDTEIEPRLVITEVNMGPILEGSLEYAAASVAVYVNVAFIGYNVLEEKYNEADTFSAIKSGG